MGGISRNIRRIGKVPIFPFISNSLTLLVDGPVPDLTDDATDALLFHLGDRRDPSHLEGQVLGPGS